MTCLTYVLQAFEIAIQQAKRSLIMSWNRLALQPSLKATKNDMLYTPDGKSKDSGLQFLEKVRGNGVDPGSRIEVWPFLLGVYDLKSTAEERGKFMEEKRKEYKQLRNRCTEMNSNVEDEKSIQEFDNNRRMIRQDAIRVSAGWITYTPTQAAVSEETALQQATCVDLTDHGDLEPSKIYHASRLVAILEAYALYDPDTGYVQSMIELLSPLLAVIEEETLAFWCFVGFMKKNVRLDEVGINRQLSIISKIVEIKDQQLFRHLEELKEGSCGFAYRTVVLLFKKELVLEQVLCLWEVIWADQTIIREGMENRISAGAPPPTNDLLLYAVAASVLQGKVTIESCSDQYEITVHYRDEAADLDVWSLIEDARELVAELHDQI